MLDHTTSLSPSLERYIDDLWDAYQARTVVPLASTALAEAGIPEAYTIQHEINHRHQQRGRIVAGRKVGLTNPRVQQAAGIDQPDYGVIFDDMIHPAGTRFNLSEYVRPLVEAEVLFVLKDDILEGDLESVRAAIDYVSPALELVDFHFPSGPVTIVDTILDNAGCAGVIIGEDRIPYGELDLTRVELVLSKGDEEVTRGVGSDVLGDPINSIHWLANTALEQGVPLRAGEKLLSGSIGMIVPWDPNIEYRAELSGLGTVSATMIGEK